MTDIVLEQMAGAAAQLTPTTVYDVNAVLDQALLGLARWLEKRQAYEAFEYGEILTAGRCLAAILHRPLVWDYAMIHARRIAALSVVVH